jgi:hypothetical protein
VVVVACFWGNQKKYENEEEMIGLAGGLARLSFLEKRDLIKSFGCNEVNLLSALPFLMLAARA